MSAHATADRANRISAFLERAGLADVVREPISGDASFRHYERLVGPGARRAVLMDAPPPVENVRPFVTVARHLESLGLSAPRIYAADEEAGLLVIEDFGDANMATLVDRASDNVLPYTLAIDVLIALHRHPRAGAIEIPKYDDERMLTEASVLTEWYLPAITGARTPPTVANDYLAHWRQVLPQARHVPESLVLRDYFPDNLMLLEGREGVARCGLLDFQDAVIGPVTYDLVSLLEDARRDVPPDLQTDLKAKYLAAFPAIDRDAFEISCAIMGAQRNLRIVGVFTRLCVRDKKPGYLRHIPRLWRLVENSVAHPSLRPIKDWLDEHVRPAMRRIPPCEAA